MFTCRLRPATTTLPTRAGLFSSRLQVTSCTPTPYYRSSPALASHVSRAHLSPRGFGHNEQAYELPLRAARCGSRLEGRGSKVCPEAADEDVGETQRTHTHTKLLSAQTSWFGSTPPANETRGDQIRLRWRSRDTHQVSETLTRHAKRQSRPGLPPCAGSRIATATAGPARSYPGYWIRLSPEAAR